MRYFHPDSARQWVFRQHLSRGPRSFSLFYGSMKQFIVDDADLSAPQRQNREGCVKQRENPHSIGHQIHTRYHQRSFIPDTSVTPTEMMSKAHTDTCTLSRAECIQKLVASCNMQYAKYITTPLVACLTQCTFQLMRDKQDSSLLHTATCQMGLRGRSFPITLCDNTIDSLFARRKAPINFHRYSFSSRYRIITVLQMPTHLLSFARVVRILSP